MTYKKTKEQSIKFIKEHIYHSSEHLAFFLDLINQLYDKKETKDWLISKVDERLKKLSLDEFNSALAYKNYSNDIIASLF